MTIIPRIAIMLAACAVVALADEKPQPTDPPADAELQKVVAEIDAAFTAGETDKALKLADDAIAKHPNEAKLYLVRALIHESKRQPVKAAADYDKVLTQPMPDQAKAKIYQRRGVANFKAGQFRKSVADFDAYLKVNPDQTPHHWRRGISHYYAGMFKEGRKQFEAHRTVNPNDVENAVWHYLCTAKAAGVAEADANLIPIQGDRRVPMMTIHALFAGKATEDDVLTKAKEGDLTADRLREQLFYAHLYIGLWHEAHGRAEQARRHIDLAATKYLVDHYMGDVAVVHARRFAEADKKPSDEKRQ